MVAVLRDRAEDTTGGEDTGRQGAKSPEQSDSRTLTMCINVRWNLKESV